MELAQSGAEIIDGGGRHQEERGHQTEDTLEHQRQHGDNPSGNGQIPQPEQNGFIKKRIEQTHCHNQRQHNAKLVKAGSHVDIAELKKEDRPEHHGHQPAQIILVEGKGDKDISNGGNQLCSRVQAVNRGGLRGQLVHFGQLCHGFLHFIHTKTSLLVING